MARPDLTRLGDDQYRVYWPASGVEMILDAIHESAHTPHAEISITNRAGHLHYARLNLMSTQARTALARYLATRTETPGEDATDWPGMVEQACTMVVRDWRRGVPFEDLARITIGPRPPALIPGWLPGRAPSILYTKGGSGKSMVAMGVAAAVMTGRPLAHGLVPAVRGPVMYLDWESNREDQANRLEAMLQGMGVAKGRAALPDWSFVYREMARPLADEASAVAREIVMRNVQLVIVDSLGAACGTSAISDEEAGRVMGVIRSWRSVTPLIVAHVNKAEATTDSRGPKSIFGSIYFENYARSTWELRKSEELAKEQGLAVGLYHRKVNAGYVKAAFGLRLQFEGDPEWPDAITFSRWDVESDSSLSGSLNVGVRIMAALKAHGKLSTDELAEEIDATAATVRKAAGHMNAVINLNPGRNGRGSQAVWALRSLRSPEDRGF